MVMTVVLPGSAQLVAGNKRVGRIAVRTAVAAFGLVAAVVVTGLVSESSVISLFTKLWFLGFVRVALVVAALGWAYLLVDAWRIADPMGLGQRHRLALTAVNGVLCFSLTGALLFASHIVAVQKDFIASVFGGGTASAAEHGRYNILLLGGDAGPARVGVRPDSITLASVDEETGRTVLFGLPRNLADVPFPEGSVMDQEFPHGFDCDGCYLNSVNTWASDHADLFPGVTNPGIEATKETVEEITGLTVNYHVLIDMHGFQELVNAVGGVTIDVKERLPIGGVGGPVTGWIEPGRQRLTGFETLWYSRSRATSDDYSRMGRQKCVMNAMLHQLDPKTVVTRFGAIADAGKQVISTSIPASELDTFVNLALKTKDLPVSTVSFVPPTIDTGAPDWGRIRTMVTAAIARSEAKDDGSSAASRSPGRHRAGGADSRKANHSADLSSTC